MSGLGTSFTVLDERVRLGEALRTRRAVIARESNEAFLKAHPDWLDRFGDRARTCGEEDAGFHLDHLIGAIEANSADAFASYVRWVRSMLEARGIGADALEEALRRVVDVAIAKMPELASEIPRLVDPALDGFRTPVAVDDVAATDPRILPFMEAVLAGRRRDAMRLAFEAAKASERFIDVYADLLQPTLYAIGHRWSCNVISVAEEHAATAVAQQVVLRLYEEMPATTTRRGRALVACVEGEHHQLGAHMVADALESDGWETRFLGSDLPVSAVLREVVEQRPNVVGIGCTMAANLGAAIELIGGIHAKAPSTHILVGGRAFLHAPGLADELGALVGGDVRQAIERARACLSA